MQLAIVCAVIAFSLRCGYDVVGVVHKLNWRIKCGLCKLIKHFIQTYIQIAQSRVLFIEQHGGE